MNTSTVEFKEFPKMARLSRLAIITEKIDGTNAQIYISESGEFMTGSRNRWITPAADNFGFSTWAHDNKEELMKLGPGRHYGEWWGQGIQRGYGLKEKRFSLFNTLRWCLAGQTPQQIPTNDPRLVKMQEVLPPCVGLVPELRRAEFDSATADYELRLLQASGSIAAPGFMKPEGIIIYHVAAGIGFKKTIDNDGGKWNQ